MISRRMDKIDSSGIRKVFNLSKEMKNPIDLSIGQPDFDVPDRIKEEAIKAMRDGFNKYTKTEGIPELRKRIAKKLKEENNIQVSPDNILVTSGVSGGLLLAFNALLDKGDEVIIPDPYFVMYKHLVNFIEAVPRYVDTYPDFGLDIDRINRAINKKTKVIILNSPGNPTGNVYSKEELEQIRDLAKEHDLVIISDEVYEKFIYEKAYFSIGSIYEKTITLNGFSKAYAMTGWRIGYAAGPLEIIQEMAKLQQYSFVCAPSFAQKAALIALDCDVSEHIKRYKEKRDLVYAGLKDHFHVQKPKGGFYIFPEVNKNLSATEFVKKAIENNVLIIPGNIFSEKDTNFRISFATSNDIIEKGVEILNEISTS
ncbi:MAG: pyridoxal phosphate-dependent aminotransferase [bacterium]|nr:pyridoxal phosphate-dependent aminotransferase [bacterium]